MRATQFPGGSDNDLSRHLSACQILPKAFSRDFVETNGIVTDGTRSVTILIQHAETFHFPILPIARTAPVSNRNASQREIEIRQPRELPADCIAMLDELRR
jgi:hypothetical protein